MADSKLFTADDARDCGLKHIIPMLKGKANFSVNDAIAAEYFFINVIFKTILSCKHFWVSSGWNSAIKQALFYAFRLHYFVLLNREWYYFKKKTGSNYRKRRTWRRLEMRRNSQRIFLARWRSRDPPAATLAEIVLALALLVPRESTR